MWFFTALAVLQSPSSQAADRAALARIAEGDGAALAILYDAHSRAIYSLALRVLGEQADAEEVVQDVFAQVWRQAARYDPGRGSVGAWMMTIARSRAIDRLRARRARPDRVAVVNDADTRERPAASADPSDALAMEIDAGRVRAALGELPLLQRIAIELAYFEGLTQSEIAERLEQPLGTIKTRVRLGLLKLRDVLSAGAAGGRV